MSQISPVFHAYAKSRIGKSETKYTVLYLNLHPNILCRRHTRACIDQKIIYRIGRVALQIHQNAADQTLKNQGKDMVINRLIIYFIIQTYVETCL